MCDSFDADPENSERDPVRRVTFSPTANEGQTDSEIPADETDVPSLRTDSPPLNDAVLAVDDLDIESRRQCHRFETELVGAVAAYQRKFAMGERRLRRPIHPDQERIRIAGVDFESAKDALRAKRNGSTQQG